MMLGHSAALEHLKSTILFFQRMNGFGQTLHIHVRLGVLAQFESLLAVILQQIREHITIMFPRFFKENYVHTQSHTTV